MTKIELQSRTRKFALRVLRFADALPRSIKGRTLGNQIARSGTSVAANYRAACRAKSKADFVAKLSIVEEEADETLFWLELAIESELISTNKLTPLIQEAEEILRITVASIKTARSNKPLGAPSRLRKSAVRNPKSEITDVPDHTHR